MANLTVPIQVNLPDDWVEQIVSRLRNDPESEWVEIVRCKDCKFWTHIKRTNRYWCKTDEGLYDLNPSPDDYCSRAKRKEGDTK